MSSNPVLFVLTFLTITCCGERNITAYVKEALTTTTCESVTKIPSVCNIDWKVPHSALANYREYIKTINESISSNTIVFGLSPLEAAKCRKAYEIMLCGNFFPVCDAKKMVINYGNGTRRCELVKKWCKSMYITCEYSTNGQQPIVEEKKKCVPLVADTSKICRDFRMKVPKGYTLFADKLIKHLSATADKFEQQIKNLTDMETCLKNYKEVLCRLIGGCSADGYYSLYLISRRECEEKLSCVKKSAVLDKVDASMCATLPNADELKSVTVKNPAMDKPLKIDQVTVKAPISPETKEQNSNPKPTIKVSISSEVEEETGMPNVTSRITISPKVKGETDNPKTTINVTISPEVKEETSMPKVTTRTTISSEVKEETGTPKVTSRTTISSEVKEETGMPKVISRTTISPKVKSETDNSKTTTSVTISTEVKEKTSMPKLTSKATISPNVKGETDHRKTTTGITIPPEVTEETHKPTSPSNEEETTTESLEENKNRKRNELLTTSDGLSPVKNEITRNVTYSGKTSAGNVSQYLAWFTLVLSVFPLLLSYV